MTKREYIDLVISGLSGGSVSTDQTGKMHPETVAKHIEAAINNYLSDLCFKKGTDYSFLEPHLKPYKNVPVHFDSDIEKYYSILPQEVVSLPGAFGVFQVSPMKDQANPFDRQANGSSSVFDHLEVGTQGFQNGFYVEDDIVIYTGLAEPCKVLMKLVVPFSKLNDFDIVPGVFAKEFNIIAAVKQQMGLILQIKEDKKNDNVAPIINQQ